MNQERRHTTRVECCYQVDCSDVDGHFSASVVNMGLGGMRVQSERPLAPDQRLQVQQTGGGDCVCVRVIWSRQRPAQNFESGVVYADKLEQLENSWVKVALRRLGFEDGLLYERRRFMRARTSVQGSLRSAAESSSCVVLDLGLGGALVESTLEVPEGSQVELLVELGGGQPLPARVIYARGQQLGLCFAADRLTQAQARLVEGYLASKQSP